MPLCYLNHFLQLCVVSLMIITKVDKGLPDALLLLVDVDDVLVGGVGLEEGVQLVHLPDVGPQVHQARGDLKLAEEGA